MKKIYLLFVCIVLFSSCHRSRQEIVNDYLDALNCYDKEKMGQLMSEDFVLLGSDTLDKEHYLARLDSFKIMEVKMTLQKIQDLDSIVRTEEKLCTIVDSLLGVTPIIVINTYSFSGNKLKTITVDSVLNNNEHDEDLEEKIIPLYFYIQETYGTSRINLMDIKKYLLEYVALPMSERKTYRTFANLQGTYVAKKSLFYKKLIFRGKRTVTVVDAIFGFPFSSSYEVDEDVIRIRTDKSDLLFNIQDSKTLIGEGFAKGTYVKIK